MKRRNKSTSILLEVIAWVSGLLMLLPMYIMFVNSFKGRAEIFTDTFGLPKSFSFEYYAAAMDKMNFLTAFKNSLLVSVISIGLIIIFSAMTSWMLVRMKNKLSNGILLLFVGTMLIPFQSVMIPLMQYLNKWDIPSLNFSMINTHYGLIFMYIGFGLSMSVFLYHGFIKGVPIALEEAAMIEGCNTWQTFWKVVFPMLTPITMTVGILNLLWIWNDYLLPSLTLTSPALRTIPLSTFFFFGEFTIQWNLAMAGLVVSIIPVIIFYLFAQKYIIKGVMAGAVK
ncbi:carbohydrate ABC transporter permease [Paenibacillus sp. B2(2019)]|uniref:carbohydrate ABC transporter permease n=1 Tax=Paenibacillus sp. B2(2019) TaxID=2607754 RepID=UPI0011F37E03|nr:carbohydrate ABC transporter permease [Paenibacillus sp. B2(2019)]KAA1187024.1 carbohydrate ABC transporter permease [Paenibacillus sp. B2(2019)]